MPENSRKPRALLVLVNILILTFLGTRYGSPDVCRPKISMLRAFSMASRTMISCPTIVFDLDGTLVDTAPDLVATLNAVFVSEGLLAMRFDQVRATIGRGARSMIERGLMAQGRKFQTEQIEQLYSKYIKHYAAHIADHSRPYPGLEAALDELANRGYRLAVCTNKLEWLSVRLLDALRLRERFAAVCGQDTFGVPKPSPDALRNTIIKAGGNPASAVMVGDSETDVATARAARIPIVAVDFGYSEVPIASLKPDRIVGAFKSLPVCVYELLSIACNDESVLE
jgi:phosphoglycolate phosphatase